MATVFCDEARRRIDARFRAMKRRGDRRRMRRLSGEVLEGAFRWLEDGIIPASDAS